MSGGSLSRGWVSVVETDPPCGKERVVRILLECILVEFNFTCMQGLFHE